MPVAEALNPILADHGWEQRVLVAAPTGCDAEILCRTLGHAGFQTSVCIHLEELCREINRGAAAAILAEEALTLNSQPLLIESRPLFRRNSASWWWTTTTMR